MTPVLVSIILYAATTIIAMLINPDYVIPCVISFLAGQLSIVVINEMNRKKL